MNIHHQEQENIDILSISGDIDGQSAPELQDAILEHVGPNCHMILDMGDVAFMSSAGLRVLLVTYREVEDHEGHVMLARLPTEVSRVMKATGFLKHFTTAETIDEAVAQMEDKA